MATSHKRGIVEDKERAAATVPTQKWWMSLILWGTVALCVGVIYRLISPPFTADQEMDRWTLLRHAVTLVINVTTMYGVSYYAARQTLARRSLKEIWKSERNRDALNRFGLPLVLSVAGLALLVATNSVSEGLFEGLLTASTLFSVYRALTTAYTAHYFDYVVSPREVREADTDRLLKSKKRLALDRTAITLGLSYPRERLSFPMIQTALVVFLPQVFISLLWLLTGRPFSDMNSVYWLGVIAPILPVIAVVIWGMWHLYGGVGRMLRVTAGRSMKGFGWQHPELFSRAK